MIWRTILLVAVLAAPAYATATPQLDPTIGTQVDASLMLRDENGALKPLASFTDKKPTLVLLGYHRCPNLCGVAQLDLVQSLNATGLAQDSYTVVFQSIDPAETADDARESRQRLLDAAGLPSLANWHFLTGDATAIAAMEAAVGLTAIKTPRENLYIHPVAVATFTPDGRLSHVLAGLDYSARDLRLAVVEASQGKLGTLGDHLLLLCSGFDPATGKYSSLAMTAVRVLGIATLVAGGLLLVWLGRRPA